MDYLDRKCELARLFWVIYGIMYLFLHTVLIIIIIIIIIIMFIPEDVQIRQFI